MSTASLSWRAACSSERDDWKTPRWLLDALGPIDLDPCPDKAGTWCGANRVLLDGLIEPWRSDGLVFCNPPYGQDIHYWVTVALANRPDYRRLVMLVPARTDTEWFHHLSTGCAAIVFAKGRLNFIHPDTNRPVDPAPFPSALVMLGDDVDGCLDRMGHFGLVMRREAGG